MSKMQVFHKPLDGRTISPTKSSDSVQTILLQTKPVTFSPIVALPNKLDVTHMALLKSQD